MWDAPPAPPTPDPDDVKIATALAGALGGLFAIALGLRAAEVKGHASPALAQP